MRRKFNLKLLGYLILGCTAFAGLLWGVNRIQVERNAGALYQQAERAVAEKQFPRAAQLLHQYLLYNRDDAVALKEYALTLLKLASTPAARYQAFRKVEDAVRSNPGDRALRLEAARLAEALYRTEEAAIHLRKLLEETPNDASLHFRLGRCRELDADYPAAADAYRKAIVVDKTHAESYEALAPLLQYVLGRPAEARALLDQYVAANPGRVDAYLARARALQTLEHYAEAEADLQLAAELAPGRLDVMLQSVQLSIAANKLGEARGLLEEGLRKHPKHPGMYQTLAMLHYKAGETGAAATAVKQGLQHAPDDLDLLLAFADLEIERLPEAEAQALLAKLRSRDAALPILGCLEARLLVEQRSWSAAAALLEPLQLKLARWPSWGSQAAALLGRCYEQLGDHQRQLAALRRAEDLLPTQTAARVATARALLETGQETEARTTLKELQKTADAPALAHVLLAQIELRQQLRLPEHKRSWDDVLKSLHLARQKAGDSAEVLQLEAEVLCARNEAAQAQKLLAEARKKHPDELLLATAQAEVALRQRSFTQARTLLEAARKQFGDRPEIRLAWVHFWSLQSGAQARQQLPELARGLEPFTTAQQAALLHAVAEALFQQGDVHAAEQCWQRLSKLQPRDLRSQALLFELALQRGDLTAASSYKDALRRSEGDKGGYWRLAQAALLQASAGAEGWAESRKLLEELAKLQPTWARVPLLQAQLAELEGKTEQALTSYQNAFDLGERSPRAAQRLAEMLLEEGHHKAAEKVLQRMEAEQPLPSELARLSVEIALQANDPQQALEVARKTAGREPNDYRVQLWLAEVLVLAGQPQEAEKTLRQLVNADPLLPEGWVALVQHLGNTNRVPQALALLAEIPKYVPKTVSSATLARGCEALGKRTEAEQWLKYQQQERPNDFIATRHLAEFYLRIRTYDKAESLLRKLLEPAQRTPAEIAIDVRRSLARVLAASGENAKQLEARRLLERNLRGRLPTAEDHAAQAAVLAAIATSAEQRKEALRLYMRAQAQQPLQPEDRFQVVKLCEQVGDAARADAQLQRLLKRHGRNPDYLAHYVLALLQRGELGNARLQFERLEQLEPDAPRTRELRERLRKA